MGQVTPRDLVRIFNNTNPIMMVSYDAKVLEAKVGMTKHTTENLTITGTLVKKIFAIGGIKISGLDLMTLRLFVP